MDGQFLKKLQSHLKSNNCCGRHWISIRQERLPAPIPTPTIAPVKVEMKSVTNCDKGADIRWKKAAGAVILAKADMSEFASRLL